MIDTQSQNEQFIDAANHLQKLQNFTGGPREFWQSYLQVTTSIIGARFGILTVKNKDADSPWKRVASYPATGVTNSVIKSLNDKLDELAENCCLDGHAFQDGQTAGMPSHSSDLTVAIRLNLGSTSEIGVAAFLLGNVFQSGASEALLRLQLMADTPMIYQLSRIAEKAKRDMENFAAVIDLMVLLNEEKRYLAMAMTFCNELASRYHCDRVSLGWLKGGYIRIQVLSHVERFERKMDAVKKLELAMEETLDQDQEIIWPPLPEDPPVCRDHNSFAREHGVQFMCSLPLRVDGKPEAVLTCERSKEPFSEVEVRALRLHCDQAIHPLQQRKHLDRWFGARWMASIKEGLEKLIGPEHTWMKIAAVCGCLILGFLCFGKLNYRIEAPFVVHSEDVAFIPAPFDGYIDGVTIKVGDDVHKSDTILTLDTHDIVLEKAVAQADRNRYLREMEKARAENALSEMRVAEAMAEQARIRLELLEHRLKQAQIKIPFDGVIVEGDLSERIGSPVKQGEVLFKVAKLENLYVNIDVNEADVHEFRNDATGQVAFTSRPKLKYPIQATRIEPVSQAKEEGNVFVVRCGFVSETEDWWRPGMTGVAKLDVGKRNVLWIYIHETIDFLRLFFWW